MSGEDRRDDGGPAFPRPDATWTTADGRLSGTQGDAGMSLRDWFAGQIVAALYATTTEMKSTTIQGIASEAYQVADAMLAERAKGKSDDPA